MEVKVVTESNGYAWLDMVLREGKVPPRSATQHMHSQCTEPYVSFHFHKQARSPYSLRLKLCIYYLLANTKNRSYCLLCVYGPHFAFKIPILALLGAWCICYAEPRDQAGAPSRAPPRAAVTTPSSLLITVMVCVLQFCRMPLLIRSTVKCSRENYPPVSLRPPCAAASYHEW